MDFFVGVGPARFRLLLKRLDAFLCVPVGQVVHHHLLTKKHVKYFLLSGHQIY